MNVPAELRPSFEALLRGSMGETNPLRKQVEACGQDLHRRVESDELDLDLEVVDAITDALENMLKRLSRKTTPLHHRLVHATARMCIRGPDQGRAWDDARLRVDVGLVNEAARVTRRPEIGIDLRR